MTTEEPLTKILPESGEETEMTVKSSGANGGDVEVAIDTPSPHDVSDQTKQEYKEHSWTGAGKFWHDTLDDAVDEYKVRPRTYRTNSGNTGLTACYIKIDYFEESDIESVVKTLLKTLPWGSDSRIHPVRRHGY